jgi:hypothetical protein
VSTIGAYDTTEYPGLYSEREGFHTMSCLVASIGKLWGDSGLKDLLIESSVYAAGSVEQMMTGKQFNSAVRALPLVYEALSSLW